MLKYLFAVFLFSFIASHSHHELYHTLNLKIDASDEDIKKAFQTLSKEHHPDKKGNNSLYVKILRAYEILSDRTKKSIYDNDGIDEVGRYEHAVENNYVSRRYNKMQPKKITVVVSLQEVFMGTEKNIAINRQSSCRSCQGTGAHNAEFKVCPHCNGQGMTIKTIRTNMGMMRMQAQCDHCGGQGKFPKSQCPVCKGRKTIYENKSFKVNIDKGVHDGDEIVFPGEGDAITTALPGDVIIQIQVIKNDKFRREGDDLYAKMEVSFEEALFGFERSLVHLDGRKVGVSKKGISQPNELIKIDGEGMHKKESFERGNLYVEIVFKLPEKVTLKQRKIIRSIFSLDTEEQ